jgi:hypothetical protein
MRSLLARTGPRLLLEVTVVAPLVAVLLVSGTPACSSAAASREAQAEAVHRNLRVGMTWNEVVSLAAGVRKGGLGCQVLGTTPQAPCLRAAITVESSSETDLTRLIIEVQFGADGRLVRVGRVERSES